MKSRFQRKIRLSGVAFVYVFFLILLILPLIIVLSRIIHDSMRTSVADLSQRSSWELANSSLMDYMRQFTNNLYADHYAALNRPLTLLGRGSIEYQPNPMPNDRSVFLEATGRFGTNPNQPGSRQRMTALVRFDSDLTKFSRVRTGSIPVDININGGTFWYSGGQYNAGGLRINGSGNLVFQGGPFIVTGTYGINCSPWSAGTMTVNGDMYVTGSTASCAGRIVLNGVRYNYAEPIAFPPLDLNYYRVQAAYQTTTFKWIRVRQNDTYQVCSQPESNWVGCTPPNWQPPAGNPIPVTGMVFLAENCNIGFHGEVTRPITVVAIGPSGSTTQGNITIPMDILYKNNASNATQNFTFGALATNKFRLYNNDQSGVPGNQSYHINLRGLYYSQSGQVPPKCEVHCNNNGDGFRIIGTDMMGPTWSSGWTPPSICSDPSIVADPELRKYPPPSLPEKPLLQNWNMH